MFKELVILKELEAALERVAALEERLAAHVERLESPSCRLVVGMLEALLPADTRKRREGKEWG